MKILMISHEYPPVGGGGAGACRAYAREFAKRGHKVRVITAGLPDSPRSESAQGGRVRITRLASRRKSPDHSTFIEMLDYMIRAGVQAGKRASRTRYDVCMTFFGLPAGPVARRLKKKYGLPYVIRFGGGDIPGFQDRFGLLYRLTGPFLKRIWRDAGALAANSEGLRALALDFDGMRPVEVIANGVDTEVFSPKEADEAAVDDSQEIRLLAVCRLLRRKGLQDVIPHLRQIAKATGRRVTLTIVGDGPYRQELKSLARESGAKELVHFTGFKSREELPEIYREADLFICPSVKEGMPNTVLEAMASGLPVIMRADCQGAFELVKGNGVLAEGDFAKALTDMILTGRQNLAQMGMEGRRRALEEFSWEAAAVKYEELFKRVQRETDET